MLHNRRWTIAEQFRLLRGREADKTDKAGADRQGVGQSAVSRLWQRRQERDSFIQQLRIRICECSVCLSVCVSDCLSLSLCHPCLLSLSCVSVSICVCVTICVCVYPPAYLLVSLCLSVCVSVCLSVCVFLINQSSFNVDKCGMWLTYHKLNSN